MLQAKISTLIKKIQTILSDENRISRLEKDLVKTYLRELYEITDAMEETQAHIPEVPRSNGKKRFEDKRPEPTERSSSFPRAYDENPSEGSTLREDPQAPEKLTPEQKDNRSEFRHEESDEKREPEAQVHEVHVQSESQRPEFSKTAELTDKYSEETPNDLNRSDSKDPGVEGFPESTSAKPQPQDGSDGGDQYDRYGYRIGHQQEVKEVIQGKATIPERYRHLFQVSRSGGELSDRLSRSPIKDLHKAFAINERLLIINDLFCGDYQKFNETLDVLNTKYSFEEAKSYIIRHLIDAYNWLDDEKDEQAIEFIKLVERRYIE